EVRGTRWCLAILFITFLFLVALRIVNLYFGDSAEPTLIAIWEGLLEFVIQAEHRRQDGDPLGELVWLLVAELQERVEASLFMPISATGFAIFSRLAEAGVEDHQQNQDLQDVDSTRMAFVPRYLVSIRLVGQYVFQKVEVLARVG